MARPRAGQWGAAAPANGDAASAGRRGRREGEERNRDFEQPAVAAAHRIVPLHAPVRGAEGATRNVIVRLAGSEERLLARVDARNEANPELPPIRLSVGVEPVEPGSTRALGELMSAADTRMYARKRANSRGSEQCVG